MVQPQGCSTQNLIAAKRFSFIVKKELAKEYTMVELGMDQKSVIGRTLEELEKHGDKGTAYIGKVVMSSGERPVLGRKVMMDVAEPHLILICGKRGGGKSYSLAVLLEELARQPEEIRKRIAVIAIDTVGIFWTLKVPNVADAKELAEWGLEPQKTGVEVLVPAGKLDFYREKKIPVDGAFTLKVSELEANEWLALFKLTWRDEEGILLTRIIENVKERMGTLYGIDELVSAARQDKESDARTKQAIAGRLEMAKAWGLFEKEGTRIMDLAKPGKVTIIDVSAYRQAIGMEGTRDIIVGVLGKKLLEERMLYRKEEEVHLTQGGKRVSDMPIVWMLIDEAHMFMPKDEESIALSVLLEWVRVGRQPGLSLVLATQRPNKLHPDCISQCDLFISHRLTSQPDIAAVSELRPSYLHQDFDKYFEEMPRSKGFALVLDDNTEKIWMIKMRPRFSWDGGVTASAFPD